MRVHNANALAGARDSQAQTYAEQQGCSGPTAPITMEELCTALRAPKPREAAGPDNIPGEFLREIHPMARLMTAIDGY